MATNLRVVDDSNGPDLFGHNGPPAATPIERITAKLEDLEVEAEAWFDGTPIENQAQADDVAKLKDAAVKLHSEADDEHQVEKAPHLIAGKAVDDKWRQVRADAKRIKEVAVAALTPWLLKLQDEQRRQEDEARQLAEMAAERVRVAVARNDGSLAAIKARDAAIVESERLEAAAHAASKAKAQAKGGGKAVGLRGNWCAEVTDHRELLIHINKTRPDDLRAFLDEWASATVRAGARAIPGVRVYEEKRAT